MKKIILLIAIAFVSPLFGQGFVQNSWIEIDSEKTVKTDGYANTYWKVDSAYLYGGGSLLSVITNNDDSDLNPSGSLGFNFQTKRIVFNLYYSYSSRNVIQMDSLYKLSSQLLQPSTGGHSLSVSSYCMLRKWIGINLFTSASDSFWRLSDSTKVDASPFILGLGVKLVPFNFENIKSNKLGFYLNASFTHRSILGDFRNGSYTIGNQLINQGGYNGFDFSANFVFDNLEFYTRYTLNPKDKYVIPGFTGSQLAFGVNLTGKVIKLK